MSISYNRYHNNLWAILWGPTNLSLVLVMSRYLTSCYCHSVWMYCHTAYIQTHTQTYRQINRGKTSKQTYKQTELAKREFESFTETACPRKSSLKTAWFIKVTVTYHSNRVSRKAVIKSLVSIHPFVSILSCEPTDFWPRFLHVYGSSPQPTGD